MHLLVVALQVPEMCFWPAKTRKHLNFLRCIHVIDLVLNYCSDINERNWLQLLFYFIVLMALVASGIGLVFFHLYFRLKFSCFAVSRSCVLQFVSKTDLTTTGLLLEFSVGVWLLSLTSYLH